MDIAPFDRFDAALVARYTDRPAPVMPVVQATVVFDGTWYSRQRWRDDYDAGRITETEYMRLLREVSS